METGHHRPSSAGCHRPYLCLSQSHEDFHGESNKLRDEIVEGALQDDQSPLFEQLANALIEATPEWWSEAELELVADQAGQGNGLAHFIRSTAFPRDLVMPTDEVFAASRALELASVRHGDSWRRCVFRIVQENSGSWRFTVQFDRES